MNREVLDHALRKQVDRNTLCVAVALCWPCNSNTTHSGQSFSPGTAMRFIVSWFSNLEYITSLTTLSALFLTLLCIFIGSQQACELHDELFLMMETDFFCWSGRTPVLRNNSLFSFFVTVLMPLFFVCTIWWHWLFDEKLHFFMISKELKARMTTWTYRPAIPSITSQTWSNQDSKFLH